MSGRAIACPRCGGRMQPFRERGVDLDRCGACGGVWFDPGEILAHRGPGAEPIDFEPVGGSPLDCPVCEGAALVPGRLGAREAFRCQRCTGFFLPRPSSAGETVASELLTTAPAETFDWVAEVIADLFSGIDIL